MEKDRVEYFEVPVPPGDGRCSDDECPCGLPGAPIPRGDGYLYVPGEAVDFRRDAPTIADAQRKVERMQRDSGRVLMFAHGTISPILMCEQGARHRHLDLQTARADAEHWWRTGQVPLRPTPAAGAAHESARTSGRAGHPPPPPPPPARQAPDTDSPQPAPPAGKGPRPERNHIGEPGPAAVRRTVEKFEGRCTAFVALKAERWTGQDSRLWYNPAFRPFLLRDALAPGGDIEPGEEPLVAFTDHDHTEDPAGSATGLVVTDRALYLGMKDWRLVDDAPTSRIQRTFHAAPLRRVRIPLAEFRHFSSSPGELRINETYHVPTRTQHDVGAGGWTANSVLAGMLGELLELRLPPGERSERHGVWLPIRRTVPLAPTFPARCAVCLGSATTWHPLRASASVTFPPGPGDPSGVKFKTATTELLLKPGIPLCNEHRHWNSTFHRTAVKAACVSDRDWEALPAERVLVTSLHLQFRNHEYETLFCDANGTTPG